MTLNDSCWAHCQLKAWSHFHRSCCWFTSPSASTWAIDFESKVTPGIPVQLLFSLEFGIGLSLSQRKCVITGRGGVESGNPTTIWTNTKVLGGFANYTVIGFIWEFAKDSHISLTFYFILVQEFTNTVVRVIFLKKESIAIDGNIEILVLWSNLLPTNYFSLLTYSQSGETYIYYYVRLLGFRIFRCVSAWVPGFSSISVKETQIGNDTHSSFFTEN